MFRNAFAIIKVHAIYTHIVAHWKLIERWIVIRYLITDHNEQCWRGNRIWFRAFLRFLTYIGKGHMAGSQTLIIAIKWYLTSSYKGTCRGTCMKMNNAIQEIFVPLKSCEDWLLLVLAVMLDLTGMISGNQSIYLFFWVSKLFELKRVKNRIKLIIHKSRFGGKYIDICGRLTWETDPQNSSNCVDNRRTNNCFKS